MTIVNCARCGKEGEAMQIPTGLLPPKDWEGIGSNVSVPEVSIARP